MHVNYCRVHRRITQTHVIPTNFYEICGLTEKRKQLRYGQESFALVIYRRYRFSVSKSTPSRLVGVFFSSSFSKYHHGISRFLTFVNFRIILRFLRRYFLRHFIRSTAIGTCGISSYGVAIGGLVASTLQRFQGCTIETNITVKIQ